MIFCVFCVPNCWRSTFNYLKLDHNLIPGGFERFSDICEDSNSKAESHQKQDIGESSFKENSTKGTSVLYSAGTDAQSSSKAGEHLLV